MQPQQQASEDDPFLQENKRPCTQRHPEEASVPCRRCRRPVVLFLVVFFSAQTPSPLLFLLLFFFFIFFHFVFFFSFFSSTVIPEKNKTTFIYLFKITIHFTVFYPSTFQCFFFPFRDGKKNPSDHPQ
jgi:hypothetical protein